MAVLGITGSIASGKSTFRNLLAEELGAETYDADAAAKDILQNDAAARSEVIARFGAAAYTASGELDRDALRRVIFADPAAKSDLEKIVHPRVRAQWTSLVARPAFARDMHLLVDIPLLFETAADAFLKTVVTVACSPSVQRERLAARGLDEGTAGRIIASQWPVAKKTAKSTFVVWNDGSLKALGAQAKALAGAIQRVQT